jgi:hypothetical protein
VFAIPAPDHLAEFPLSDPEDLIFNARCLSASASTSGGLPGHRGGGHRGRPRTATTTGQVIRAKMRTWTAEMHSGPSGPQGRTHMTRTEEFE